MTITTVLILVTAAGRFLPVPFDSPEACMHEAIAQRQQVGVMAVCREVRGDRVLRDAGTLRSDRLPLGPQTHGSRPHRSNGPGAAATAAPLQLASYAVDEHHLADIALEHCFHPHLTGIDLREDFRCTLPTAAPREAVPSGSASALHHGSGSRLFHFTTGGSR